MWRAGIRAAAGALVTLVTLVTLWRVSPVEGSQVPFPAGGGSTPMCGAASAVRNYNNG